MRAIGARGARIGTNGIPDAGWWLTDMLAPEGLFPIKELLVANAQTIALASIYD
jgi:hypothetical protein